MSRKKVVLLVILLVLCGLSAEAAKKGIKMKAKELMLPRGGYPEITEAQASLTEVPFAPGVPAVILRQSQEYEWQDNVRGKRDRLFRRVKILTEGGIEDYGDFTYTLYGDWRVHKVQARTVLPDGSEIDAGEGINQEETDDGVRVISIVFPQVQVGAILDLDIHINSNGFSIDPWMIQGTLPILDSRLVMRPPTGLRFRIVPYRLPAEKAQPDVSVSVAAGSKAHGWIFRDVEPLPDLANLPPRAEVSKQLFIILEQLTTSNAFFPIAKDWQSWGERDRDYWEEWFKTASGDVKALAREVIPPEGSSVDKAEAVRVALADRFRANRRGDLYSKDTPDEQLRSGSGPSGALAGIAAIMLRSAGVEADLAVYRHRSGGRTQPGFPIPSQLTDVMLRIPGPDGQPLYFDPGSDQHVTRPTFETSGVLVFPLDGKATEPVQLPDFKAAQNQTRRIVRGELTADGTLIGKSESTYIGVAAELLRRRLKARTEEQRHEYVERRLQRFMSGLALNSLEIENLEDSAEDLVLKCEWSADGYASVAGKRLILNPSIYSRVDPADWAAESRTEEIDLGTKLETHDTLMIKLPANVGEITAPDRLELKGPPVGTYETHYERRGQMLVAKRHLRLDMFRLPAQYYAGLRQWFSGIAAADENPVVIELQ